MLKGLIVNRTGKSAPYIHDLPRLAKLAELSMSDAHEQLLIEMFPFNIAGRYADDKLGFYKAYNKQSIAKKYMSATHDLFLWLKHAYKKK
jgi:HEPN domain-containing protein